MGKKNENLAKIASEYEKACEKHPKFCDMLTGGTEEMLGLYEFRMKRINANGPYYAEFILKEEVAEALHAYVKGDLKHAIAELAQCGAVILRMMQFVQDEMEADK